MKVMAINSSQRTQGESLSEKLLLMLVEGMRDAKAEVEIINLREHEIKFCQGCFSCWTKTPGICRIKDDMTNSLFPKWLESDIVVYASPLFFRGFVAQLQTFVERTLPSSMPYLVKDGEKTRHPVRTRVPDSVILSVAGFPEIQEFNLLSDWVNSIFNRGQSKFLAEIYRPAAQALALKQFHSIAEHIYAAVKLAGSEIIRDGKVNDTTMAKITQPICEKEEFLKLANLFWDSCIDEQVIPKQFRKLGRSPRPKTVEDIMMLLPYGVNQTEAKGLQSSIQMIFESEEHNDIYLDINHGTLNMFKGKTDSPDITIKTPFQVWSDIMSGLSDGAEKLMEGAYSVEGDGDLLIRLFS